MGALLAAVAILVTGASDTASPPVGAVAVESLPVSRERFVALTDDDATPLKNGCDEITIADSSTGQALAWGEYRMSPGQLAASSDGKLLISLYNNGGHGPGPFVYVMKWQPGDGDWSTGFVDYPDAVAGGANAVAPDDGSLLVSTLGGVAKFRVADVTLESLGPVKGSAIIPPQRRDTVPADIVFTSDSKTAYVVANDGNVHTLDVESMRWSSEPIAYAVTQVIRQQRTRFTYAGLSPDERWLVINTGDRRNGHLNVIDLTSGQVELVKAEGLAEAWGVEFDYAEPNRGLLAVHGRSQIGVYRFDEGHLLQEAITRIPPPNPKVEWPGGHYSYARTGALAWSGDGTRLIVRRGGGGLKEWRILELGAEDPVRLSFISDLDSCTRTNQIAGWQLVGFDVLTLHDRLHRPTLTPTLLPSPTLTASPPPSPSPSASHTPTLASPTNTPTPTAIPVAIYLPIAVREHCDPEHQRSDIALVIDTSSSMTGQKLVDARDAALTFVGMIDLAPGRSQVSVVRCDREAEVMRELTCSRPLVEAAIRSLHVRSGTHIDKGLRAALAELQSTRHLERNEQVVVLLTDGIQTGTPGQELQAAAEVRAAGVRLYAIGLGEDVDEATLRAMAGADERYYFAPDSGDLARIYGEIAVDLMCPGVDLWGGR